MRRQVLIYGIVGGLVVAGLKAVEYRWLIVEHSVAIYGGIVAAVFAALGIWLGVRLVRPREIVIVRRVEVPVPVPAATRPGAGAFVPHEAGRQALGITPRELEIVGLIAEGLSNREIAARLDLSENTIKTHSTRAFDKLGARRRTQAVQLAKRHGLIP
ncbi:MAG: response regulator transcription factor [Gemmatimonadota bacterium]|nr:response regulator transcription factor [Gemmatimonadota bacterium]